jgi:DNA topoisomerase VI subunit B
MARDLKRAKQTTRRSAEAALQDRLHLNRHQHRLRREVFRTSRLLEFCSEKELINQTGHAVVDWPLVIHKELVDNALDAIEETGGTPVTNVRVANGQICVSDNGPGIATEVVTEILNYNVRVSSREAYVSPTRGAQGSALKTIIAMPFAVDGSKGETLIESRGIAHRITFRVDHVRQEPKIEHSKTDSDVRIGTRVTVFWPVSARSKLADAKARFLQIAQGFAWLNPHLTLVVDWEGQTTTFVATDKAWTKWSSSDPTSPHWYDEGRLARLMGAYVARDQDRGREPRTVREFVAEFRGLSATAKQKAVLDQVHAHRVTLPAYFGINGVNEGRIAKLLNAMRGHSRPVKPKDLGFIGESHLRSCFTTAGADEQTFRCSRQLVVADDLPQVIELAFGYCPKGNRRQIVAGVNWSPGIVNPFRVLGRYGQSLDTHLSEQRAGNPDEPITLLIHMACPRVDYTDRGKSALVVSGNLSADEIEDEDDGEE